MTPTDPMEEAVAKAAAEAAAQVQQEQSSEGTAAPRRTRAKSTGRTARSRGGSPTATGATEGGSASPPPPPSPSGASSRPPRVGNLQKQLEQWFGAMALIPSTMGDAYSAQVIVSRSAYLAEAWADLAKQSPAVRRVLEGLVSGGAWGGAIMASCSIVIPIASYHGLLPQLGDQPLDPWAGIMPVQPPPRVHPMPPASPPPPPGPPPPGVIRVPFDVAAQVRHEGPAAPAGGPVANSGPGQDPSNWTAPLTPDQPPGVVTVAGNQRRWDAVRESWVGGSSAPDAGDGTATRDPDLARRSRAGVRGSAAPNGSGGNVERIPPAPNGSDPRAYPTGGGA